LISSGDDGFLYIWEKERIIRKVFAHEGAIYALHCQSKLGLVVSGGMEGIVTLWRLLVEQKSNVKSLERLRIYNMRRNMDPF
jgi:WD40 repeat protein